MAIKEAPSAVVMPITTITVLVKGDRTKRGCNLINTQAPVTTTRALRIIEAGIGPSMASSNQRCRGNWAHLATGPAKRARHIKLATVGSKLAVVAHSANSSKFQVLARGRRATTPIKSIKSPTRLVKKASLAPVTTKDWLNQKPIKR